MLPPVYQQLYQDLQQTIEELQKTLATTSDASTLKTAIAALQTCFQTQIWNLDLQNLEPKLEHQIQSVNVEIDKQLRLLSMDTLFLQTARQASTIAQRKQQMGERLSLLKQYCSSLTGKE
jgi:cell division septum initiation protein DivIVA